MRRAAVFLDRDGTLNQDLPQGVTSLEEFVPLPGAFAALGRLTAAGWPVVLITNQSGVSKGIVAQDTVDACHERCRDLAAEHGGRIDGVYYATDLPGSGGDRRKPRPGMLVEAAHDHDLDLFRSYMIGDAGRDLLAGKAAGCTSLLVLTGKGEQTRAEQPEHRPEHVFNDLEAAVDWILAQETE